MKGSVVLLIALLTSSCAGKEPRPNDGQSEAAVAVGNQHMALAVLASVHYCKQGEWPSSVAQLKASEMTFPVMPDWQLWTSEETRYEVNQHLKLHTGIERELGYLVPATTNVDVPSCNKDGVEVHPHIVLGE